MALPLVPTDTQSGQERQHRTQIATATNELIRLRQPNEKTAAEAGAGVDPVDFRFPPFDVRRYNAKGDGTTDDRAAFVTADSVGKAYVEKGTYRIASNLTITNQVTFEPGAVLKPDSGVTITLSTPFAATTEQIFDLSAGGTVVLPPGTCLVYAEWWGARGDGVKTDNNVPINQAAAALSLAGSSGPYGGEVTLLRGTYLISNTISLNDEVGLVGQGKFFTNIRAASGAFGSNTYMIHIVNGTSSLFNSPLKNLRINAANDGNILACVYAPAWQQKSGAHNVYIENFKNYGILIDNNYGGSAQLTLSQVEVFQSVDAFAGSRAIKIDATTFSVGWLTVNFKEIQCGSEVAPITFTAGIAAAATSATLSANWGHTTGAWWVTFSNGESRAVTLTSGATTATWTGGLAGAVTASASGVNPNVVSIDLNGRVIGNVDDVHFEQTQIGVILNNAANIIGDGLKSDGSGTVPKLVQCSGAWTGQINMRGMKRAGSLNYIVDNSRGPYPLANVEPFDGVTIWPPSPAKAFAAASFSAGGSTPSVSFGTGFSPDSRVGTGQYRINLSTAASSSGSYYVLPVSMDSAAPDIAIVRNSASQFDVFTYSAAGVATDCGNFALQAFHIQ